jgi:sialate O-acetylesterase
LYFFGRELHQTLKQPVGLIHSSWGGTPIQPWMPLAALRAYPGYAALLERKQKEIAAWPERERQILAAIRAWEAEAATNPPMKLKPWNPGPPDSGQYLPANLYNGMIHPLIGYALRGVVWYQGESNADGGAAGAADYADLQGRMIAGWRAAWAKPKLPFLFVQLPNWNNPGDASKCSWAFFREGQARAIPSII